MSIEKPNGAIGVFEKVSSHLEHLVAIYLLNIVAVFEALLLSIGLILTMCEQVSVSRQALIVVINLFLRQVLVERSLEMDEHRLTASSLGLDACLDHLDSPPVFIIRSLRKLCNELCLSQHPDLVVRVLVMSSFASVCAPSVSDQSCIREPW